MSNNTVEFIVRMRDLMSGGLSKLSTTPQSAFNRMSQHAQQMTSRNRVLSMSYNELQKRIREVENTVKTSTIPNQISAARRELASLQRMANRHPGNLSGASPSGSSSTGVGGIAMGAMLGNIGAMAGAALLGAVKDGVGAMLSATIQKERDVVGLRTFLGKEGADQAYANIRQDAGVSPYDTKSLLEVNRALISAGLNAKEAREDSMNLANAISAVGGGNAELSRMAANMQQIKTVGKASALDIKQFGYVGINIYEMLARSTGKSIEQVKEMDVTYEQLAKALSMARGKGGIYEGALEAQGQTMGAKIEQVKDKFSNALIDIGDKFAPIINKVLDVGIKIADSVGPLLQKAQPYIDMIASGLGQAIDYILGMGSATSQWSDWIEIAANWYSRVWEFLKGIIINIWKMLSGIIDWAAKSEIIKDAIRLVHWLLGEIFDIVGEIGNAFQDVWENGVRPLLEGLDSAYSKVKSFFGFGGEEPIKIEATKVIRTDQAAPLNPYQYNLTRFAGASGASATGQGEEKSKKNKERGKKTGDTIAGGGPRVVNISVGKFFDNLNFNTLNTGETTEKLESIIMKCLGRTLFEGGKSM